MADIVVHTDKLKAYAQRLSAVNNRLNNLDYRLNVLYWRVGLAGLFELMQADALTGYSWRLARCRSYLLQTATEFETTENLILRQDPIDFKDVPDSVLLDSLISSAKSAGASIREVAANMVTSIPGVIDGTVEKTIMLSRKLVQTDSFSKPYAVSGILGLVTPFSSLYNINKGILYGNNTSSVPSSPYPYTRAVGDWLGYEVEQESQKIGVTGWLGKAGARVEDDFAYAGVNAYLGQAKSEAESDFSFMEETTERKYSDGKWQEETVTEFVKAKVGAGVSVSALAADAEAGIGNDMLGAEVEGEGSVGTAEANANAEFSVTEKGVNALVEGEAMLSAAKGKVSGTFNILGFDVKLTAGGYAGAIGAEGKIGVEDNKFVAEGGVAALLGVSVGVEVGLNETGFNNFIDFITFWD